MILLVPFSCSFFSRWCSSCFFVFAASAVTQLRYQPVVSGEPLDEKSVLLKWEQGDKTPVQIDMSSLNPDNSSQEVMTAYKYLTTLEKQKKVTTYEISYSNVSRCSDSNGDGFKMEVKSAHLYRTIPDSCWSRVSCCCINFLYFFGLCSCLFCV